MPTAEGQLTQADEITLTHAMDRIIPAVDDLPGAGGLGLGETAEKLASRTPRLRTALIAVLDALSLDVASRAEGGFAALDEERQDQALRTVEMGMPDQFAKFVELVYCVYYTDSRVHARIRWAGRPPQPEGFEMEPWDESILQRMRTRKPFWRKVSG